MSDDHPLVVIAISTFNGELYLREQFNSLLNQTYKNIKIIIRDDGSEDGTCEILQRFAKKHENVEVFFECNIGVVGSFLRLLDMVPSNAEYVAFCDQDDVWNNDKVEKAVSLLGGEVSVKPSMYCGAVEVVDEKLKHIAVIRLVKRKPSLENALVQNVATGCTTMINREALLLITSKRVDINKICMHDWWLYQVISAFGHVLFDDTPKIKYRQHGGNVVGSSTGIKLWVNRIKRHFGENNKEIRCQAKEFLHVYGSKMPKQKRYIVSEFLEQTQSNNIVERLAYAVRTPVYRQSIIDDLVLRTLIIMGRI